jgi:hypothetical protein
MGDHVSDETTLGDELIGWRSRLPEAALADLERLGPLVEIPESTPADVRRDLQLQRQQMVWDRWVRMIEARYSRYSMHDGHLGVFDGLAPEQHPADLRRWLGGTSRTLFLVGPTGRGKTHAAIGVGYEAALRGVHTTIVSQLDYLAKLRPGGSDDPARERYRAETTTLLIFDDLGAETEDGTEFVRREVCALFDARVNAGLRTVITTNANPNELVRVFGDRIVSRIRDDSVAIEIAGHDRRRARSADDPW